MIGNSFYKFIHPCDHEEVAKELGGKIPLEDMEIFDGLFCSDSVFVMANNLKGGVCLELLTNFTTITHNFPRKVISNPTYCSKHYHEILLISGKQYF